MKSKSMFIGLIAWVFILSFATYGEDDSELRRKADAGDSSAQFSLGKKHYLRGGLYSNHRVKTEQYKEAIRWLLPLADAGRVKAQYMVGKCYAHGYGVAQSEKKAVFWLSQASEEGDELAKEALRDIERCRMYRQRKLSNANRPHPSELDASASKQRSYEPRVYEKTTKHISSTSDSLDSQYGEGWKWMIIPSFLLTWGIGLAPPLLIRRVFVKRPLSKRAAVGLVALFWIINMVVFAALGSRSKTHMALIFVAWVSYGILHAGYSKQTSPEEPVP